MVLSGVLGVHWGSGKVFPADKGDCCTSKEWLFGKFSCQRQRLVKAMWSPPTEEEREGEGEGEGEGWPAWLESPMGRKITKPLNFALYVNI